MVEKGFVKVALADPMKRFVLNAFGLTKEQLWGPSEARNKTFKVDTAWWYNSITALPLAAKEILNHVLSSGYRSSGYLALMDWFHHLRDSYTYEISARVILQTLGTEWGREVDPLMWSRYAHKTASYMKSSKTGYSQELGILGNRIELFSGVVIPDHRFANEVEYTQAQGGSVIRLRRLALEKRDEVVGIEGHKSEAEQKTLPDSVFNLVLEFPEGIDKVHSMLETSFDGERTWMNKSGDSPSS